MRKRGAKSPYTDAQWDWVMEKFREGYTLRQLAQFLDVTLCTVQSHVSGARAYKEPLDSFREEFCAIGDQE